MLTGFAVDCGDGLLTESDGFSCVDTERTPIQGGETITRRCVCEANGLETITAEQRCDGGVVVASTQFVNRGSAPIVIRRIDSYHCALPPAEWTLHSFGSAWGKEFTPATRLVDTAIILESKSGRSTNGDMPMFWLSSPNGPAIVVTIAWSGNWAARFDRKADGGLLVAGGLHDWEFAKSIGPGESIDAPDIVYAVSEVGDADAASRCIARFVADHWIPRTPLIDRMPFEWNSWWPYEDNDISEHVFQANVDVCAGIGIDVCTLDAGWFGAAAGGHGWWELQGDWSTVNSLRFPSGIPALGDYVHARGLKFGLWCEIEAVGIHAALRSEQPQILATRDGSALGYVCLGCPDGCEWAYRVLKDLIVRCHADWLKIDFNLDPGAGCNRTDHGHQVGDGLYEHYRGLYALFDRIRGEHPDVVLETCSSGGLRIDLGILRHTHVTFLSDPDYSVHALQVTWGALTAIPSRASLKFSWSQNKSGLNNLIEEPISADTPQHRFDSMMRVAMLGQFGCSYRLPDLPSSIIARLAELALFHKTHLAPVVRDGDAYRLSGQPLRTGEGDRWTVFQYLLSDRSVGAVAVFRLSGADEKLTIRLQGLDSWARYRVLFVDGWAAGAAQRRPGRTEIASGDDLMSVGLTFAGMPDESSEIVLLSAIALA